MNAATTTLTLAGFRRWLESLPPGQVVGQRARCALCPLAAYLTSQGAPDAYVAGEGWSVHGCLSRLRELPLWADRFMGAVDGCLQEEFTAGECLEILTTVERAESGGG